MNFLISHGWAVFTSALKFSAVYTVAFVLSLGTGFAAVFEPTMMVNFFTELLIYLTAVSFLVSFTFHASVDSFYDFADIKENLNTIATSDSFDAKAKPIARILIVIIHVLSALTLEDARRNQRLKIAFSFTVYIAIIVLSIWLFSGIRSIIYLLLLFSLYILTSMLSVAGPHLRYRFARLAVLSKGASEEHSSDQFDFKSNLLVAGAKRIPILILGAAAIIGLSRAEYKKSGSPIFEITGENMKQESRIVMASDQFFLTYDNTNGLMLLNKDHIIAITIPNSDERYWF